MYIHTHTCVKEFQKKKLRQILSIILQNALANHVITHLKTCEFSFIVHLHIVNLEIFRCKNIFIVDGSYEN